MGFGIWPIWWVHLTHSLGSETWALRRALQDIKVDRCLWQYLIAPYPPLIIHGSPPQLSQLMIPLFLVWRSRVEFLDDLPCKNYRDVATVWWKFHNPNFNCFCMTNGRTDRWTDGQEIAYSALSIHVHAIMLSRTKNRFYARQRVYCPSVCPSVCHTGWSYTKTVEARITKFSPYGSPIPLVFREQFSSRRAGALNKGRVGKIGDLHPPSSGCKSYAIGVCTTLQKGIVI